MILTQPKLICCIVLAVSFCGVLISYALPKRYEASSTVFIEQNVIGDLVKGIAITPSIEAKLRVLQAALLSRGMLLGVMRELDMDLGLDTPAEQERRINSLRANTNILHDERKGLFAITYTDKNPALARDFVNTLTRRYIEESTSSKRRESIDATSFLAEQIKTFQKRIDQAQEAVDAYKAEKGMYLGLNEYLLRDQIRAAEQRLDELRIRENECRAQLRLISPAAQLRKTLEERERDLRELQAAYTDRHPLVVRTSESVKNLRATVRAEEAKGESGAQASPEYQKIQVELESLESMEAGVNDIIAKNTRYLHELPEIRTVLASLEQRRDNEALIYQQLVSRYGQSEVSKQMELQDKSVSFNIIDSAVLPTVHKSPPRFLIIVGAMLLGLGLSVGIILARDLVRPTIRSRADLEVFGVEILATVPSAAFAGGKKHRRGWKLPAFTCLILAAFLAVAVAELFHLPYVEAALRRLTALI